MRIGYEVAQQQQPMGADGGTHRELQSPQTKGGLGSISPPSAFHRNSVPSFAEPFLNDSIGRMLFGLKPQRHKPYPLKLADPKALCSGGGEPDAVDLQRDSGCAAYEQEEPLDFSSKGRQRHSEAAEKVESSVEQKTNGTHSAPTSCSPRMPSAVKEKSAEAATVGPADLSTKEIVRNKIELRRLAELRNAGCAASNKCQPLPPISGPAGARGDQCHGDVTISTASQWWNFGKHEERERLRLAVDKTEVFDDFEPVSRMVPRARPGSELLRVKKCLAGNANNSGNHNKHNGVNMIGSFGMLAMNGFREHFHHAQQPLPNVPMSLLSPSSSSLPSTTTTSSSRQHNPLTEGDDGMNSPTVKLSRPFKSYPRDPMLPFGYCGLPVPFLSAATDNDLLMPGQQGIGDPLGSNDSYEEFKRHIRQLQQQQKRPAMTGAQIHFNGSGSLPLTMSQLVLPRATLQQHRAEHCESDRPLDAPSLPGILLDRKAVMSQKVTDCSRDDLGPGRTSPMLYRAAPNSASSTPSTNSSPSPNSTLLNLTPPTALSGVNHHMEGSENHQLHLVTHRPFVSTSPTLPAATSHPCVSPPSSSGDSTVAGHRGATGANLSGASLSPNPSPGQHSFAAHSAASNSSFGGPTLNNGTTKKRGRSLPDELKDEAYWERRRKNNEAAKRSRDARRAKEDEIAIRAAFLEQENLKLRVEVAALKSETAKLRCLLYNS